MAKILVNAPTGKQEVITIHETGSYFDLDRVLWDTRKDGPLPVYSDEMLGGLIREGIALKFSHARKREYDAQFKGEEEKKRVEDLRLMTAQSWLEKIDLDRAWSLQEIESSVKNLIRVMRGKS